MVLKYGQEKVKSPIDGEHSDDVEEAKLDPNLRALVATIIMCLLSAGVLIALMLNFSSDVNPNIPKTVGKLDHLAGSFDKSKEIK